MSCSICCSSSSKTFISCTNCSQPACSLCYKKYLYTQSRNQCIYCSTPFTREFMINNFKLDMINKFELNYSKLFLETQKELLSETLDYLNATRKEKTLNSLLTLLSTLNTLNDDKYEFQRSFLKHIQEKLEIEKIEILSTRSDWKTCISDVWDHILSFNTNNTCSNCYSTHIVNNICTHCQTCIVCTTIHMAECNVDILKSIEYIQQQHKKCPNCKIYIEKSEGCNQMFCTHCKCSFDWQSLQIIKGKIHNPHYFEWIGTSESILSNSFYLQIYSKLNTNLINLFRIGVEKSSYTINIPDDRTYRINVIEGHLKEPEWLNIIHENRIDHMKNTEIFKLNTEFTTHLHYIFQNDTLTDIPQLINTYNHKNKKININYNNKYYDKIYIPFLNHTTYTSGQAPINIINELDFNIVNYNNDLLKLPLLPEELYLINYFNKIPLDSTRIFIHIQQNIFKNLNTIKLLTLFIYKINKITLLYKKLNYRLDILTHLLFHTRSIFYDLLYTTKKSYPINKKFEEHKLEIINTYKPFLTNIRQLKLHSYKLVNDLLNTTQNTEEQACYIIFAYLKHNYITDNYKIFPIYYNGLFIETEPWLLCTLEKEMSLEYIKITDPFICYIDHKKCSILEFLLLPYMYKPWTKTDISQMVQRISHFSYKDPPIFVCEKINIIFNEFKKLNLIQ